MSTQFWDRLWRSAGLQFVVLFVIACFIYGDQPGAGSSSGTLASFYDGHRLRILVATFILGMAVLNLLWFAAAIRDVLRAAGQDGWGSAVTASSAALGGVLFVLMAGGAALAYRVGGAGNEALLSGLNDAAWACLVITSFPRAMLIMSATFGMWRAGMSPTRCSGSAWRRWSWSCWAGRRGQRADSGRRTAPIHGSSRRSSASHGSS